MTHCGNGKHSRPPARRCGHDPCQAYASCGYRSNWSFNFRSCLFDFNPRIADVAQPLPWILLQCAPKQSLNRRRCSSRQSVPVRLGFEDASQNLAQRFAFERRHGR